MNTHLRLLFFFLFLGILVAEIAMDGLYTEETYLNHSLGIGPQSLTDFTLCQRMNVNYLRPIGSVALLSHFHKVLALSKFALLKCKIEVNHVARIPWATSTTQIEIAQCWWPTESVL